MTDLLNVTWEVRGHPWGADWWVVTEGWKPGDPGTGKVASTNDLGVAIHIAGRHNAGLPGSNGRPRIPLNPDVIQGAMALSGGRVGDAAAILGVSRHTFRRRLDEVLEQKGGVLRQEPRKRGVE